VVATLVNASGCYAQNEFHCGFDECAFDRTYHEEVAQLGSEWATSGSPPRGVQTTWKKLMASAQAPVVGEPSVIQDWWHHAMRLLAIADEACSGVGFVPKESNKIASDVFKAYRQMHSTSKKSKLPYAPASICRHVPDHELCVQPKTRTPQIGCTLRSLTHNLALLPGVGEVRTRWDYAISSNDNSEEPFNILLVPFPYRIRGASFAPTERRTPHAAGFAGMFELRQTWLDDVTSSEVVRFVQELIDEARAEVETVHAVVFPEAALTLEMAHEVALTLAEKSNIELFVSGAVFRDEGDVPLNLTYSSVFKGGSIVANWIQSKHHRWKLDEVQIRRYHLGHVLGKKKAWWEGIDVAERECHFFVFRHGASLAVLICEDLARIDPVQSVVRAIGPNLVIALLMDGAQLERRWPGRYATVLADDPGSAVLTLTSVGLIRRANMPTEKGDRFIGLWKESSADARQLELPAGCHSLLLTVSPAKSEHFTADGRSDATQTINLSLTSIIGLRLKTPPEWLHDV